MNEFLLIFRAAPNPEYTPTPEQLRQVSQPWLDWMTSLASQNKLANQGNRLAFEGSTLTSDKTITNGPYVEIKEVLVGYTIITAESLEEATETAKGCPILNVGGSVEVRAIVPMEM